MEELINERGKLIIKSLITKGILTLKDLKVICNVSERTISKDLDSLQDLVREYNLTLVRKPKLGIWVDGKDEDKEKLFIATNVSNSKIPSTPKERQDYILLKLILNSNYITIQELCDEIYVSRGTLENDFNIIKGNLKKKGIEIKGTTNKGIKLEGDEKKIRVIIASFFSKLIYIMPVRELITYINSLKESKSERYSFDEQLFNLFSDIDLKFLEKIIKRAEEKLGYEFTDTAFTLLLIHLAIAIKRINTKNIVNLPETMLVNIKGTKEYEVAEFIGECVEGILNVKLPKTECAYISIHILGSKIQYNFIENNEVLNKIEFQGGIKDLCEQMLGKASQILNVDFCSDTVLLKGLCIHIRTALNRFFHDIPIENPLLSSIKNKFITSFEAAVAASEIINEKYKLVVDENEIAYIALHFEAAVERMRNNNFIKKRIIIVCSSGIGTSQLVAAKLKRIFNNLEIVDIISSTNIESKSLLGIDLLITTIPITVGNIPVVRVNPLLLEEDIENIKKFITKNNSTLLNKKNNSEELLSLVDKNLILLNKDFSSKEEAINEMCRLMYENGFVEWEFCTTVHEREKLASTSSGRIALPHGDMDKVYKSVISLCTLKKRVNWEECRVDLVIMLAIKKNSIFKIQNIFDAYYDIISDSRTISKLVSCHSVEELLDILVYENN